MTDRLDGPSSEDRALPALIYGLYLLGGPTGGLTTLIGVIVSSLNTERVGGRMRSHLIFLNRTFWFSLLWTLVGGALLVVGIVLTVVLVGIPFAVVGGLVLALLGVWYYIRVIIGCLYLARDEAYPRPMSWWW